MNIQELRAKANNKRTLKVGTGDDSLILKLEPVSYGDTMRLLAKERPAVMDALVEAAGSNQRELMSEFRSDPDAGGETFNAGAVQTQAKFILAIKNPVQLYFEGTSEEVLGDSGMYVGEFMALFTDQLDELEDRINAISGVRSTGKSKS